MAGVSLDELTGFNENVPTKSPAVTKIARERNPEHRPKILPRKDVASDNEPPRDDATAKPPSVDEMLAVIDKQNEVKNTKPVYRNIGLAQLIHYRLPWAGKVSITFDSFIS